MTRGSFETWAAEQLRVPSRRLHRAGVIVAFDLLADRIGTARVNGSADPLRTLSSDTAGGNSRACTQRALAQLRLAPTARRATLRLLAGSASGWPGLIRLFVRDQRLTPRQRRYARRQLLLIEAEAPYRPRLSTRGRLGPRSSTELTPTDVTSAPPE